MTAWAMGDGRLHAAFASPFVAASGDARGQRRCARPGGAASWSGELEGLKSSARPAPNKHSILSDAQR